MTVHSLPSVAALTDSKGWLLWRTPAAESSVTWLPALEGQRPARVWVLPPGPSFPISSQFQLNPLQLLKCGLDRGPQPWLSGSFPSPELLQAFAAAKWQILQGIGKRKEYDRKKAIINVLLAKSVSRKSCTSGGLTLFFCIFNGFCALCWSGWILTRLTRIHLSSSKGKATQNFISLLCTWLAGCWAGMRRYLRECSLWREMDKCAYKWQQGEGEVDDFLEQVTWSKTPWWVQSFQTQTQ